MRVGEKGREELLPRHEGEAPTVDCFKHTCVWTVLTLTTSVRQAASSLCQVCTQNLLSFWIVLNVLGTWISQVLNSVDMPVWEPFGYRVLWRNSKAFSKFSATRSGMIHVIRGFNRSAEMGHVTLGTLRKQTLVSQIKSSIKLPHF